MDAGPGIQTHSHPAEARLSRRFTFQLNPLLVGLILLLNAWTASPARAQWVTDGARLTGAAGQQLLPALATDGSGGAYAVWTDSRHGNVDLFAQHPTANGTLAPGWPAHGVPVCTLAVAQSTPRIAPDGMGGAIVVWSDARNGNADIFAQRLKPGGTVDPAWPVNGLPVCTATGTQTTPAVASDGLGGAFIVWS